MPVWSLPAWLIFMNGTEMQEHVAFQVSSDSYRCYFCTGARVAQSLFPRPRPTQRRELFLRGQPGASSSPYTVRGRMIFIPGVSMGTKSMDCCWWRGACGSVFPINTQSWQRGSRIPARKGERQTPIIWHQGHQLSLNTQSWPRDAEVSEKMGPFKTSRDHMRHAALWPAVRAIGFCPSEEGIQHPKNRWFVKHHIGLKI